MLLGYFQIYNLKSKPMTKPTILALGLFGILIVAGIAISSTSNSLPLVPKQQAPRDLFDGPNADSQTEKGLPVLADRMPDFRGITKWWNTPDGKALTPTDLKGKVVLLDFWTYSCINCIRTFPFIKAMQERYADKGLVIVGVHTPEFAFEADPENVSREIKKNGFKHPIALDPNYETWRAYQNQYWPAEYFFDRQGRLRHTHFGEGSYDENEEIIRQLLAEDGTKITETDAPIQDADLSRVKTAETYFGLARGESFLGKTPKEQVEASFVLQKPQLGKWSAEGRWIFMPEYVQSASANSRFRFTVQASKFHLVLESADGQDKEIEIFVDGKSVGTQKINISELYTIASFEDGAAHTIELVLKQPGVRFYAATFS